jgi:DNA-binding transcriptional LysR family regulator
VRLLPRLNANLLVALDALLTERNVTTAGKQIGLSQPAMSAALAQLRMIFEDELLVRVGRRYVPTTLAEELSGPLRSAMVLLERALEAPRAFDPATAAREFSLAVSDYVLMMLAPSLIATIAAGAPAIRLRIDPVEASLQAVTPDLAIVPDVFRQHRRAELPEQLVGWRTEEVFHDRWVFAVASDNPDVGNRMVLRTVARLAHVRYAAMGIGGAGEGHLDDLGVERRTEATVGSLLAALFLLRGTRLATLTPERLAKPLEEAAGIRIVKPAFRIPDIVECMMWSPVFDADAGHKWLRETVRAVSSRL